MNEEIIKFIIYINLENLKLEMYNWMFFIVNFIFDIIGYVFLVRKYIKER